MIDPSLGGTRTDLTDEQIARATKAMVRDACRFAPVAIYAFGAGVVGVVLAVLIDAIARF